MRRCAAHVPGLACWDAAHCRLKTHPEGVSLDRHPPCAFVACLIALALSASAAQAADFKLVSVAIYDTGVGSYDVKACDLNQDGKPDIVAAIADGHRVAVLLNDGTGQFPMIQTYPVGKAVALDTGDYDGDGKPDVLDADYNEGTISLRLNLGGGLLGPVTTWAMGTETRDVVGADFDGDGLRDVAAATASGILWVRPGLGPGGFGSPLSFSVGGILKGVTAGDYDNDGRIDIVLVDSSPLNRAILMHNDGGLAFSAGPPVATGGGASDVALHDLDGDGWLDLAVANEDGTVSVARNQQDGTFAPPVLYPVGHFSQSIAVADFNGDGRPDLLCSNYSESTVSVLLGQGGMLFGPTVSGAAPWGMRSAAPADFDGDGRVDVVTGEFDRGTVHVLQNVPIFPHAVLETPSLEFGTAILGVTQTLEVRIRNTGESPLVVYPGGIEGAEFELASAQYPLNVAAGATGLFGIRYARNVLGSSSGVFHLTTNDPLLPDTLVTLHGTARDPGVVSASGPAPRTLAVGEHESAQVVLRNVGAGPLHVTIPYLATDLTETCPQDVGALSAFPVERSDASLARWDILGNGTVATGTTGEYAGGMLLTNFLTQAEAVSGLGGREVRLGPVLVAAGVLLTRKVYVPTDSPFARFVDVVENPSVLAKTVAMELIDNTGYVALGPPRTSSGDALLTPADDWIVLPPDDAPERRSVARVFRTAGAPNAPVTTAFAQPGYPGGYSRARFNVSLPPHGRACVVEWAIQAPAVDDAQATAAALDLAPAEAFAHMDAIDRSTMWNADPSPAVFHLAGGDVAVAAGDSAVVEIVFDAASATHDADIHGALRILTDDPTNPLVVLPLELRVTGGSIVAVEPGGPRTDAGARLALGGLVPNPARASGAARIAYRLATSEPASIALYDLRGRVLARRALEHPEPGPGSLDLAGLGRAGIAPGVYWLRLTQGARAVTRKGIVLP